MPFFLRKGIRFAGDACNPPLVQDLIVPTQGFDIQPLNR